MGYMRSIMPKSPIEGKYLLLFVFALATLLRGLPELLSGPYPVGYDLLAGYAPSVQALPEIYPLKLFGWLWSPLSVFILWFFWKLSQINLFVFLKIAGPVSYGLFASAFYFFVLKGMQWSKRKSLVATLIFVLQPGVLRTGWDQLRLMLGFVFLFVLLAETKCDIISGVKKKPLTVIILSVLLVLSQQLIAVLFFIIVSWQLIKSQRWSKNDFLKVLITLFPPVLLFVLQLYFSYFVDPGLSSHFMPIMLPSGSSFFAFTNYFLSDPRFVSGDYFTVLAYVGNLSLYVVVPLVPFAVKGFFKDKVFFPMLVWLLIASYSIILIPWFALSYYWFWTFLLPIPLTIYACNALDKSKILYMGKRSKKLVVGLFLLIVIGVGYATSVISVGYPFAYSYMPPGLVKSCVGFGDIHSIEEAFAWANTHLPSNVTVIVPENLQGFASMYSRPDLKIRVAPALLGFDQTIKLVGNETGTIYALYFMTDVETSNGKSDLLVSFRNVGVFSILM
jgi:hypothetical protein